MAVATERDVGESPLSVENHQALAQAQQRARKIGRAAAVAAFNGWTLAALALVSAACALTSLSAWIVTALLAGCAYIELQGRSQLRSFDPRAARRLGWNQLALMSGVMLYSLWQLAVGLFGPSALSSELAANPELRSVIGSVEQLDGLYRLLVCGVYGSVMLFALVFQGGNAWYYFTRQRLIEQYLTSTPQWILDVQRAMRGNEPHRA